MRLLSLLLALPLSLAAQATPPLNPQHTVDAATIIEGPQAPGIVPAPPAEPTLMGNDTVLRMHTAGLTDDLILQTIATQPGRYDTSADALIQLKQAGLADAILTAMANKQRRPLNPIPTHPAETGPIVLSPVNEIGVYYKDKNGVWQPMESEPVHIKSGGFLKHHLTNGIIKEDHNGVVSGREAKLVLFRPTEFLIYTADGVTASEYEFVRFRLNSKDREFRVLTGGVIHSSGGAQRDEQPFEPHKLAPRTYTFTVTKDIPGGEFGIMPPGTGNVTNGGKIYTFALTE